jgi:hypothetical protein
MEVLIRGRAKYGKSVDTAETNETDRKIFDIDKIRDFYSATNILGRTRHSLYVRRVRATIVTVEKQ